MSTDTPITTPTLDDLVTVDEFAELVGFSAVSVRRWIARGLLPAYRLGPRLVRVDRRDARLLVTRREVSS